jgi:hypothetical protein
LPQEHSRRDQAEHGERKVELDDGPDPEDADGRSLLHDSQIAVGIRNVYEVAASTDARDEENALPEGGLVTGREAWEDGRVGLVGVEGVEEQTED